jgi:threonine dehydratase
MSDNEMAKDHVRYMVGGRANGTADEVIYRFQFPERPGALLKFLTDMTHPWNISLFHYRNHGAEYGNILVGLQIPASDQLAFQQFLTALSYEYWEETDNPAYQLFL